MFLGLISFLNNACSLDANLKNLGLKSDLSLPSQSSIHEFGVNGELKLSGSNKVNMNPRLINILSDGKIILGQIYETNISDYSMPLLYRMNPNGTIDTSYGSNGYVELPDIVHWGIRDMASNSDGTYLLLSKSTLEGFKVLRLLPNGTTDTSFGTNGVYEFHESGGTIYGRKIALTSNGSVLVAAYRYSSTTYKSHTILINNNGTLNSSHGVAGIKEYPNGGSAEDPKDLLYISDSEIYLLNHVTASDRVVLRKLDISGVEDVGFSTTPLPATNIDTIRWIRLKKINNRLVVFGNYATAGGSNQVDKGLTIVCLTNGNPDTTFNTTGTLLYTHASISYGVLDVQGITDSGSNLDFQIAYTETQRQAFPNDHLRTFNKIYIGQYNSNGSLDSTYGTAGVQSRTDTNNFRFLRFQSDNSLLATGQGTGLEPIYYSALTKKFTNTLSSDTSFGAGGTLETIYSNATKNGTPKTQAKLGADHFLYSGRFDGREAKIFVVKTDKTGMIQTQFGDGGYIRDAFSNGYETLKNIKSLSSGSIMVCGESTGSKLSIAKFASDGSRDLSFGSGGVYTETITNISTASPWFCGFNDDGTSIGILATNDNIVTVRILANGTRDMAFGTSGINVITIPPGTLFDLISFDQSSDERTVVAGISYDGSMNAAQFLLMISSSGYVDTSFSGDGYVELRIDNDSDHSTMGLEFSPDGKLYTVFDAYEMPSWDNIVVINRYNVDGSLDTSFGSGSGYIQSTTDFHIDTNMWGGDALTIDSSGNIYILGLDYSLNLTMKSWKSNGSDNTDFGLAGNKLCNFPIDSQYRSLNNVLWDSNDSSFKILSNSIHRINMSGSMF